MILAFIAGALVFAVGLCTGASLVLSTQTKILSHGSED